MSVNHYDWPEHILLLTVSMGGTLLRVVVPYMTQEEVFEYLTEKFVGMVPSFYSVLTISQQVMELLEETYKKNPDGRTIFLGE